MDVHRACVIPRQILDGKILSVWVQLEGVQEVRIKFVADNTAIQNHVARRRLQVWALAARERTLDP